MWNILRKSNSIIEIRTSVFDWSQHLERRPSTRWNTNKRPIFWGPQEIFLFREIYSRYQTVGTSDGKTSCTVAKAPLKGSGHAPQLWGNNKFSQLRRVRSLVLSFQNDEESRRVLSLHFLSTARLWPLDDWTRV